MYTASSPAASGSVTTWFNRAVAWLDDRGKGAWIAAMVLSFIFVWPLGLFILGYMIWSKRMFKRNGCGHHHAFHGAYRSSGNTAFDAYKAETLRRLEDEQDAFNSFLQRLRDAKDKSEFDAFMADRAKAATAVAETSGSGAN
ncbi:DUF2852 domain-containing protein [Rhodobacter ferrooxidans]|uniref:DUF2852 domain-containing protein n=1 Tax=Rhodobacter ferrooxidans TaxID=371731 RepID=C8RXY1_9RHOB|nr:DUF2852 domain-containing protein [Rhodobacter sp. SW2]EEW26379.1 conserved hypothetical protein [Rhodobacter sp. SW2]